MSTQPKSTDPGVLIRRSLFVLVMVLLTFGNLFTMFKGLNTPQSMDQAQLGREIARGNGFTTKVIRPVAVNQVLKTNKSATLVGFPDTYHAPLNPLIYAGVLKMVGADSASDWQMNPTQWISPLDRVIAAVSTLFFLLAIGVNYLLVSRIFDAKIAGVCAILMLFCESMWGFALSGLPQMLLLFLFSCGAYFAYRAIEASTEGRVALAPAILAGVFFVLMALAHWLCVWIVLGYILFAAIAFRPRGIVGGSVLLILFLAGLTAMVPNSKHTDSPFGTSLLMIYQGLGNSLTEETIMRTDDLGSKPPSMDGIVLKLLRTTILQATDIIPFLGGIIIAPVFFLSLFHSFKRPSIARFRWALLLMWVFAAIGMTIFGISKNPLDANQIHLLFAPIMTAYGLAFISILWSRIEIVAANPILRNVHHILIVLLCAAPLVLALPPKIGRSGAPAWPPYFAQPLNIGLKKLIAPDQVCFSDQPWAVAWYADRTSVWLPTTKVGLEKIERVATQGGTPSVGILITPSSHGSGTITEVIREYGEFASLVIDGPVLGAAKPAAVTTYEKDARLEDVARRYPFRSQLFPFQMVFYSDRRSRPADSNSP